jgi:tRNA-dihydrouridine synthase
MLAHLDEVYAFYGEDAGVRVARKHLGWYRDAAMPDHPGPRDAAPALSAADALFREMRVVESAPLQRELARAWLEAAAGPAPATGGYRELGHGTAAPAGDGGPWRRAGIA